MNLAEQSALLAGLNRKDRVEWLPELKAGKEAFHFIANAIAQGRMKTYQKRNGLLALFKLRAIGNGDDEDAMRVFVQAAQDREIVVRSEGVKLAIGLAQIARERQLNVSLTEGDLDVLRAALCVGVEKPVAELAEEFLHEHRQSSQ